MDDLDERGLVCVCRGNWRLILSEYEHLFDRTFRDDQGRAFTFFGLVHGSDDYYYGLWERDTGKLRLVTCVGGLEPFYKLVEE